MTRSSKPSSPPRHESHCAVCGHPRRQEIERQFIEWVPQSRIAKDFRLSGRLTVWRHAKAFGLVKQRNANIRAVLANFIERASRVRPTAQALIAAVVAFSKLDVEGRSIERIQNASGLDGLFQKMTRGEMLRYAQTGELPAWFNKTLPDTQEREGDDLNG
jgi:hypothetical protein